MTQHQESQVQFDAQGINLEGRFGASESRKGVIITHPHTQYGGTMDNTVVEAIAQTYRTSGWCTLRFNFRGAGNSQGAYDNGRGEQQDVEAAMAYLAQAGMETIELAGYSFGAWVISLWAQHNDHRLYTLRLVAPPVAFMDYRAIGRIEGLAQVIVGGSDDIAPAEMVRNMIPAWQPEAALHVIDGADHFFSGHIPELQAALEQDLPV